MFHNIVPCDLYYKHVMIVNDDSSIIEASSLLMTLESSFTIVIDL